MDSEIVLADNVWIGARAVLLTGARIGEGAAVVAQIHNVLAS